ncbi:MAG: TIR domain-containing protein [Chitinophagales bacterium]|nr:TIR domain-containing protein [Chitinophagales bacterium]
MNIKGDTTVTFKVEQLYILYAPEDNDYLLQFQNHLIWLQREGLISLYHEGNILAGSNIDQLVDEQLQKADMVVLLLSVDFIKSSRYIAYTKQALALHKTIVPILLRPCVWQHQSWEHLQSIPNKAVSQYADQDLAFYEITLFLINHIAPHFTPPDFATYQHQQHAIAVAAYEQIANKTKINRGSGTSDVLMNKTTNDLNEQQLEALWKAERVQLLLNEESEQWQQWNEQERLRHLELAENGHLWKGTFLCLGKRHQIRGVCESATESKFIVFKGKTRDHILAMESLNGNVLQQYEKMMLLLRRYIPLGRDRHLSSDIYEIPMVAVKELVANAFVHRNYDPQTRSLVQVELFDDRLEIKSPGQLPHELNPNHIEASVLINPSVSAIFYLFQYVERAATGIHKAQTVLKEYGLPPAEIVNIDSPPMVKVTIMRPQYTATPTTDNQVLLKQILQLLEQGNIAAYFEWLLPHSTATAHYQLLQQLQNEYLTGNYRTQSDFVERLRLLAKIILVEA